LRDAFGRDIVYLRLSVTDRCNLRCRYCMPEEGVHSVGHGNVLTYEELLRVAEAAMRLGIRKIRITGGEPLVRRGICSFINELTNLPGAPEVTLTTNGLLLEEMAQDLRAAGLRRINVSLDTLKPDRFLDLCRRDGLPQVLKGIEKAEAVGFAPVKINMVPIRGLNGDEIGDFARLTLKHPWEVRFIEYMPVSSGLDYGPENRIPADVIMNEMAKVGNLTALKEDGMTGPARMFRYRGAIGLVGIIPAVSEHFCDECNRLRITADGRIRPCLFSVDETDLREHLRNGASVEVIAAIMESAILAKPERHLIGEEGFRQGTRRMGEIGG